MREDVKYAKILTVYKAIIITLSILSTGLCAICTALFYDYSPGYFRESTLCSIFSVCITVTVLFALSCFTVSKKTFRIKSPNNSSSPCFLYLIPACGFLFYAISTVPLVFKANSNSLLFIAHAFFGAITFVYFLLCNLDTRFGAGIKSIIGLVSVICPLLIAIRSYFDYNAVMNSPEKTYLQFSMVAFALYIINEARFILGDPYPRLYVALSGIIFPVSSCYTVNKVFIIANSANRPSAEDIALCILAASIAIYSLFRIIYLTLSGESCTNSTGEPDASDGTAELQTDSKSDDQITQQNHDLDTII